MMKTKLVCLLILALHLNAFVQVVPKGTQLKSVYVNGRWGYADPNGRVVIPPQFSDSGHFSEGLARVSVLKERKWLYGFVDKTGRVVIYNRTITWRVKC
jgi:WG containing repeat